MSEEKEITKSEAVELAVVFGNESGLFTISSDGMKLTISEDVSYEQYRMILKVIKDAGEKYKIWLADAIKFGNKQFGPDRTNSLLEQLEFEMPVVRTALAIESIPDKIRELPNLTTDHLYELSKAENRKHQLKWARLASEHHLTPVQLRLSIVEDEIVDRAAARMLNSGVVTVQGIRQSFEVWRLRIGGVEGVSKLESEDQRAIIDELEVISHFCADLKDKIASAICA